METPTYQQLLAEIYEENSKNLLVHHNEYEDEEVDEHETQDYEKHELENPDEFNKFHGDRGTSDHVIMPKAADNGIGKTTLKHNVHIRNIVLNIDSAFRGTTTESALTDASASFDQNTTSSWFIFSTSRLYKNITSAKLTSLEFPNTFYAFSAVRGNTTFTFECPSISPTVYTITIADGNYQNSSSTLTLDPQKLLNAIQVAIQSLDGPALPFAGLTVVYDPVLHKTHFNFSQEFTITFPKSPTNPYNNGIGYNLGFTGFTYTAQTGLGGILTHSIFSDMVPDVVQDRYVYLAINDWNLVDHQNLSQSYFSVFAKIQLPIAKNSIVFDSNYINSSTKEYFFQQPVNIQRLEIKLLDAYGNILYTNGQNWSMTLELKQVNDSSIYEALL